MKVYKIVVKDNHRISFVKDPAVEETLLTFSAEDKTEVLHFANEEKRIIYSVAMRPNKMIFRKDVNGEPAYVYYTEDMVEKFQQEYFKKNPTTNVNHTKDTVDGIYPIECWKVENFECDKSKELGLNAKNGDLVMAFKVENDEVWNQCKSGDLDGLSIEGTFSFEEDETNKKNIEMNKEKNPETLWELMKSFFAVEKKEDEEEVVTEEETVTEEVKEEEVKATEEMEVPVTDEPVETIESLKEENLSLKEDIAQLKETINSLEAEKVKAETELQTMSKQVPATESVKNVPVEVVKTYEQMSNFEKLQFNRQK